MDKASPAVVDGKTVTDQVALKHGDIMEIAGRKFRYEVGFLWSLIRDESVYYSHVRGLIHTCLCISNEAVCLLNNLAFTWLSPSVTIELRASYSSC